MLGADLFFVFFCFIIAIAIVIPSHTQPQALFNAISRIKQNKNQPQALSNAIAIIKPKPKRKSARDII
jgi:hypothetical protein